MEIVLLTSLDVVTSGSVDMSGVFEPASGGSVVIRDVKDVDPAVIGVVEESLGLALGLSV